MNSQEKVCWKWLSDLCFWLVRANPSFCISSMVPYFVILTCLSYAYCVYWLSNRPCIYVLIGSGQKWVWVLHTCQTSEKREEYALPSDKAFHVSPPWDGYRETGAAAKCTGPLYCPCCAAQLYNTHVVSLFFPLQTNKVQCYYSPWPEIKLGAEENKMLPAWGQSFITVSRDIAVWLGTVTLK